MPEKEAERKLGYPNAAAGRGAAVRQYLLLGDRVGTTLGENGRTPKDAKRRRKI